MKMATGSTLSEATQSDGCDLPMVVVSVGRGRGCRVEDDEGGEERRSHRLALFPTTFPVSLSLSRSSEQWQPERRRAGDALGGSECAPPTGGPPESHKQRSAFSMTSQVSNLSDTSRKPQKRFALLFTTILPQVKHRSVVYFQMVNVTTYQERGPHFHMLVYLHGNCLRHKNYVCNCHKIYCG